MERRRGVDEVVERRKGGGGGERKKSGFLVDPEMKLMKTSHIETDEGRTEAEL